MFEPLNQSPAYVRLSETIRARILERRLKDGEALPTETELARQFAVNRSTVREALRNLQSAGLIARRSGGKKLFVTRPTVQAVGGGLSEALTLHDACFGDILEALLALEPDIAAAAASRRSSAQLEQLGRTVAAFGQKLRPAPEAVALVGEFFRSIGAASGNPVFVMANEPLVRLVEPSLAIIIDCLPKARQRIASAQTEILAALAGRDSEAAAAWMRRHVEDFRRGFEQAGLPLATIVGRAVGRES
jgi:DNA-binding FadR family transcriptional regulator